MPGAARNLVDGAVAGFHDVIAAGRPYVVLSRPGFEHIRSGSAGDFIVTQPSYGVRPRRPDPDDVVVASATFQQSGRQYDVVAFLAVNRSRRVEPPRNPGGIIAVAKPDSGAAETCSLRYWTPDPPRPNVVRARVDGNTARRTGGR